MSKEMPRTPGESSPRDAGSAAGVAGVLPALSVLLSIFRDKRMNVSNA